MSDVPADTLTTTIADAILQQLVLYTLPANYNSPLYGQTHEEVAERCAPLIAAAVVSVLATHNEHTAADAWDEGFDAGERDVFNHEQAGWRDDDPCIANPYRLAAVSPTPPTHKEQA